jgi:hypothetical protein
MNLKLGHVGIYFLCSMGILVPSSSYAGVDTSNVTYSAEIINTCTISLDATSFQLYSGPALAITTETPRVPAGIVTASCSFDTSVQLCVGGGTYVTGSVRELADGSGNRLQMGLWRQDGLAILGDSGCDVIDPAYTPSYNLFNSVAMNATAATPATHNILGSVRFDTAGAPNGLYETTVPVSIVW